MVRCKTLLLLLTVIAAMTGYAAIAPWLQLVPRFLVPLSLLGLLWQFRKQTYVPSGLALVFALVIFVYFLVQVPRQGIVSPAVGFMASLLALRLVSEKSARHYLQICALSIFLLAASSLYSLSPLFMLYLAILVLAIIQLLVLLTFSFHDENMVLGGALLKKVVSCGFAMQLATVPCVFILFLVLPRTQIPLWRFGAPVESSRIGFSESVRPGTASSVVAEKIPVLRAEMSQLPEEELYWRGTVLNRVVGGSWSRSAPPASVSGMKHRDEKGIRQLVQLEPGSGRFLFALDTPVAVRKIRAAREDDGVYLLPAAANKKVQYEVISGQSSSTSETDIDFYLQVPPDLSPRLVQLANRIRDGARDSTGRVTIVENEFRSLGLVYDTKNMPVSSDPVDAFLFEAKRGNCEFFASACGLVLRMAGIPTRLVGGYYGGLYNELGGYYLVTRDMAHVWVEYYQESGGWRRIDPSTWGTGFAHRDSVKAPDGLSRLRLYIDTATFLWESRVIPFDFENQLDAARNIGARVEGFRYSFRKTGSLKPAVIIVIAVVVASVGFILQRSRKASRVKRVLMRFEKRLRRSSPGLLPLEKIGVLGAAKQSGSPAAQQFAHLYASRMYGDGVFTEAELAELGRLVDQM